MTPRSIEHFNKYAVMADQDFGPWVYTEERALQQKGLWRPSVFEVSSEMPVDLEIGVGNGYFFEHLSKSNPERKVLGIELKFKALIQTIKRTLRAGCTNARMIRFDASEIDKIFGPEEINNVYIFFPDPWPKKRHHKNRLFTYEFLNLLYSIQKPGSTLQIKTDSAEYFDWILERVSKSPYRIEAQTTHLHESNLLLDNFVTHFEKLWTGKGLKTHYLRLGKASRQPEFASSTN